MTNAQNERSTEKKQNLARFFLEQKHVAWVSLAVAILWGTYGLLKMPQRKDPDIPVRQAMIIVPWQGASAEQVEQLVTRKIEQAIALNQWVTEIKSASRTGSAMVQFELAEKGKYDRDKELDDVKIRLDAIHDLPQGTGPILYIKDFGDTSALMLTVASPPADPVQVAWISKLVETEVRQVRSGLDRHTQPRRSVVVVFPKSIDSDDVERKLSWATRDMATQHLCSDMRVFSGAGFTGVDLATNLSTPDLQSALRKFANQNLQTDELHPDAWEPAIIDEPANTTAALQSVAGDQYTYRDLDDFTDTLQRSLKTLSIVAKAERSGVLDENVFLNFSQERLAQYKLRPADLSGILAARNLPESGQTLNARGRTVSVNTTGEFKSIDDLRNVVIGMSPNGTPLYLRDLVDIDRGYENPPSFLNRYTRRDENGRWITTRAITLSVQMKKGEQIGSFGKQADANLANVRKTLPADLVLARTSDQPLHDRGAGACGSCGFDWLLELADGHSDCGVHADYARDHVWGHQHARDRPATGLYRFTDHCAGAIGRCTGGVRRRNCARTGCRPATVGRRVAGTDKAIQDDGVCNPHEYRLLSSISAVAWRYREIPVQSAYRH